MRRYGEILFQTVILLLTALSVLSLAFVIYFVIREALPLFSEVSLSEFLLGKRWMPVDFTGSVSFGIFNFIAATLAVSFAAMAIALFFSVGAALWLSLAASERTRALLYPLIDLLAGIPSVIYGFIGLVTLVRIFIRAGIPTGLSVLSASIVLSVMLLPYLISSVSESLLKAKQAYLPASEALGVSKWYAAAKILLPAAAGNIVLSLVLAIGRAMGETMAVMMVIGNANLFPRLLGKSETIASVIALEMGTAVAGSTHYHALYAAGFVLMLLLFLINLCTAFIRERIG